ncbi:MAG: aminotransferase class I/II-fold pyridoxal phosphate-dependent enzyme, partial [Nitrospirae bacterium]|nr:aminotransferase class I/II-fold pyridoxal phosphate-dependent enzyme [Nitrospirota bacterium]
DVISLAVGDPVEPTPEAVVEELCRQAHKPENHRYPTDEEKGMLAFRQAVADWYADRYSVSLDPETEALALIGSKEGCHHFALAVVDPGDIVLVTDPGYPGYRPSIWFAGGEPYSLPIRPDNGFLPRLEDIPAEIVKRATAIYLNYPNNPTGAVATRDFFKELIEFAGKNEIAICHDNPYSEIVFEGEEPLSLLSLPGAKEVAVELNSLSKPYNMAGWRIGMAVGNPQLIAAMSKMKANTDSGLFNAIQFAGITALRECRDNVEKMLSLYRRRRNLVVETLNSLGWNYQPPPGTFYLWIPTPGGMKSRDFVTMLFDKTAVVVPPGSAYGQYGEGYFRISLTVSDERLTEAMERFKNSLKI